MVGEQGEVNDVQPVANAWLPGAQALPAILSRVVSSTSLDLGDQALLAACMEVSRADCGYIAGFSADLSGQRSLALWAAQPGAPQPLTPQSPVLLCAAHCDVPHDNGCPCASAAALGRAVTAALSGVRACAALQASFASALELVTIPLYAEGGRVCGVLGLGYHALHTHLGAEDLERQLGPLLQLAALSVLRRAEQRTCALLAQGPQPVAEAQAEAWQLTAAARSRIAERTDKAQRLESLGVLAGGIAHDFNNLLLAIMGNIGLSRLDLPPDHEAHHGLHQAEAAAQRAAVLCRQLLAYSGRGRFVLEPVDLSQLVLELQQRLSRSLGKKTALQLALGSVPAIEGALSQLRDVVASLVENAAEAVGDQPGSVMLSTGVRDCDRAFLRDCYLDDDLPEGRYVVLEVSDTGCGMSDATRERVFEPFFSTKFMGRGLGMSSVLGVVRSHRGAIRIRSQEQYGTTIQVLLPVLKDESEPPAAQLTAATRPGTVLVIDDEAHVRAVTQRMLELAGFQVLIASDGPSALPLFHAHRDVIDVVLLDMTMPQLDGRETFLELKRMQPAIRVVLTSGYSEQEAFAEFQADELVGFLPKPYRPAELVQALLRAQIKR